MHATPSFLDRHFPRLLAITGVATMLPGLQFIAPTLFLGALGMQAGDSTGIFFARHWGLMVFCFGALLLYAARHPAARRPLVYAAAIEKLGLVVMVLLAWNDPALAGMHGAALFDALCVLLYSGWLLKKPAREFTGRR
jgi:hypothetical protein